MKTFFVTIILMILSVSISHSQLLNKIKKKAEQVVSKPSGESEQSKQTSEKEKTESTSVIQTGSNTNTKTTDSLPDSKASSKSDFVPGGTVLYYDNFEKDNTGESPIGWITSSSAEVVAIDGLRGKWLKLASISSEHFIRSKKQSWGNSFTIEFDLVIVKNTYDPRIDFSLINTSGKLVTDETILRTKYYAAYVSTILGENGKRTRLSLFNNNNINHPVSDQMSETLPYQNNVPVHVSICVQGKGFRFWWNEKKLFDNQLINEQYMPNQFGFSFGSVGGADFYISNIRVAKDIGMAITNSKPTSVVNKPSTNQVANPSGATSTGATIVALQSKILTANLPYAQIMKTGESSFTFTAGKEEGNNKENYFKILLQSVNTSLKPETYNFREINQKNSLYGTKKYAEISNAEAVLYYGTAQKPYIYKFSPIIANGHMASFVSESLERKLPAVSPNCKLVIEKVEDGKASGYFLFGIMIKGLKPITKGDAMTETFTDGFSGEMKCTFSNVPVY
jgi:hypothetical protein